MESSTVQGATLLLLNLPQSALAGIDILSFTTSPRFKGIKQLPPGLHFAFTAATNSLSIRHGAWFRVEDIDESEIQLFTKKWDDKNELLVSENDQPSLLKWRANLGTIWREGLSPYRQSAATDGETTQDSGDWERLTNCISDDMLSRITGDAENEWSLTSASSAKGDVDEIPGLKGEFVNDKMLKFLPVELKNTWRAGATGRERTDAARDHSWALGELLDNYCDGNSEEILGEMQFCFLMVLTLNNYSCLEQWKRIIRLLFTCKSAVAEYPQFYINAVRILRLQLQHCQDVEGGLFDLSDDGAGFLKQTLRKFKKSLDDIDGTAKSDVIDELDDLGSYLRDNYGWDLEDNFVRRGMVTLDDGESVEVTLAGFEEEDESGEYAPTIVELSEDQLGALSGSPQHTPHVEEESEEEGDLEDMDARY